jgi:hypothetical protein
MHFQRSIAFALVALVVLVACTKPDSHERSPQLFAMTGLAAPADGTPLLLDLVAAMPADNSAEHDATALGTAVDVYLLERAGRIEQGAQVMEMLLLFASPSGHRVNAFLEYSVAIDGPGIPFGSIRAIRAIPAASQPRAPLLFEHRSRNAVDGDRGIRIEHDGDSVVLSLSHNADERSATQMRLGTTRLAAGARVATPDAAIAAPTHDGRIEVRERVFLHNHMGTALALDLLVGNARAPIAFCADDNATRPFEGERVVGVTALTDPPPSSGTLLATRHCADEVGHVSFALEQRGRSLVVWRRTDDSPLWTSNDLPMN